MRVAGTLTIVAALAVRAGADDAGLAQTYYDQARKLVDDGKLADACPLFAASFKADAQLGVLLNLADCHEKIGKLATAYGEFRDAADRANRKHDEREAYAKKRADALAPRLARVKIVPPTPAIAGLTVTLDGADATPLLGVGDAPLDPGEHVIVATAPGRAPRRTTVKIEGEGKTVTVQLEADAPPEATAIVKTPPPPVPSRRFDGVRVFAGLGFDSFEKSPDLACMPDCNSKALNVGLAVGARARWSIGGRFSFDPYLSIHQRSLARVTLTGMQTAKLSLDDLELAALMRVAILRGRAQLGFLLGPYATVRVYAGGDNTGNLYDNRSQVDVGGIVGIELFVGRWGGQAITRLGAVDVSPMIASPVAGLEFSVGFRI